MSGLRCWTPVGHVVAVDFVNITSVYNFQQHTTEEEDEIYLYKVSVRI